jgi:hypothetical protein
MRRHLLSLIATGCLLSNCASTPPPVCGAIGWDAYDRALAKPVRLKRQLANATRSKPDPNIDSEKAQKALTDLRPYSAAWWAVREQMDAEEQRRVSAKLVICRGCLPTSEDPGESTGSTNPTTKK